MKKNYFPGILSLIMIYIVLSICPWHVKAQEPKSLSSKKVFDEYWYLVIARKLITH